MKRPTRNIAAFVTGDAGTRFFGFIVNVYLARFLGPEGYGIIGIGLALNGQLSFLASPGMSIFEVRTAAAFSGADPVRVAAVTSLRALLATIVSASTWVVVRFWPEASVGGSVAVLYVVALLPMSLFLDWFFQAKEKMWPVSASRMLHYGLYAVGVVLFVHSPEDILFAPIAYLVGAWAAAIFLQVLFRKWYGTLVLRWQPRLWLQILRENLPVGAAMLLGQSTVNLPPLVLGALAGSLAVGTFTAALKLAIVFLVVDRVLNALLLPVMTRYLTSQGEEAAFLIRIVLKVMVAVVLPLTLAGVLMASWLVGFVFGPGYEASAIPLQILMGYVGMTILNSVFVSILLGEGRMKSYLSVSFAGAAFMVALLLILTPVAGPIGAAIAMAVGEAALVVLVAGSAAARGLPDVAGFTRLILSGAGMVVAGLAAYAAGPFVATLAAMVAYALLLLALRAFAREEIAFLRERLV